jgi:hypothetical protein
MALTQLPTAGGVTEKGDICGHLEIQTAAESGKGARSQKGVRTLFCKKDPATFYSTLLFGPPGAIWRK